MTASWLKTSLGEALLRQEARIVEEALDGVFGEQCLQLGIWGRTPQFSPFFAHAALCADRACGGWCALCCGRHAPAAGRIGLGRCGAVAAYTRLFRPATCDPA